MASPSPSGNAVWDPLPTNYQGLKAGEKLRLLWQQIKATEYPTLPAWTGESLMKKIKVFSHLSATLDHVSDIMPENRPKAIHTYGVVGQIEFLPIDANVSKNHFTGVFASGAQGVIRFSLATDPSNTVTGPGYLPGIAIKLLRDGMPSANVVANHDLNGQGRDANFFRHSLQTWLPAPSSIISRILFHVFKRAEPDPGTLPVYDLARFDATGRHVEEPVAPNMLKFKPAERLQNSIPSNSTEDFRIWLSKIQPGLLYEVYAQHSLSDVESRAAHVAEIYLVGDICRASSFGDERLFFQHQRKNPSSY